MLDSNYNIKIIDFGDARKINEPIDDDDEEEMGARPSFCGTVNYLTPEMIDGGEQGHPIDVWALGCILFKLLTGGVPFKGTIPDKVYNDIKNCNI
jgi:serine/threonine protein kinase